VGRMSGVDIELSFPSLGKVSIVASCFWYELKTDSKQEDEAATRVRQIHISSFLV
jgi:hypothetical protein